jgi:sec-independent protein translocase protein TatA
MDNVILLSMPGGPELLVLFLIVLLLFGAKRIPEVAQNLGKGIREFKKSMREVQSEIDTAVDTPKAKVETPKPEDKAKLDSKNE